MMISPMRVPIDISKLSVDERLDLISELWDSLDERELPALSADQLAELDRRIDASSKRSNGGKTWQQVKARMKPRR